MHSRIDRGTPDCLVMKPRRSSICIIWLTLGADTRKCRCMSDSAGALPNRWMYLKMKVRYSSWRFVRRDKPRSWADTRATSTRASSPSGVASTMRTVPHVNWMLIPPHHRAAPAIHVDPSSDLWGFGVQRFCRVVILWRRFVGSAAQRLNSNFPPCYAIPPCWNNQIASLTPW